MTKPGPLSCSTSGERSRVSSSRCLVDGKGWAVKKIWARLALVVGLVMGPVLVLSAGPAQALQPDPLTVKTVEGIARALGPKVAARYAVAGSVCGTGVGCPAGIVAGIGITAYELYQHQDVWMPWVKGLLGESVSEGMCSTAPWTIGNCVAELEAWQSTTSTGINVTVHYSNTITSYLRVEAVCRNPDGTTYAQGFNVGKPNGTGSHVQAMCAAGTNTPGRTVSSIKYLKCPSSTYTGCAQQAFWERAGDLQSIDAVIKCQKPDLTTYLVAQVTSTPTDGVHVRSCDPGDTPVDLSTSSGGKTGINSLPLGNDAQHDSQYPLCVGPVGTCGYQIKIDGIKCQVGVYNCVHWSHIATNFPARVRCEYGPYGIDVSDCAFMERAYESPTQAQPQGQPVTGPNVDGNPGTYTPPAPDPSWNPNPTPTPTPSPTPTGSPSASPSPSTSSSSSPSPSSSSSPSPDGPGTSGQPNPSDPVGSKCWPSGWGWFNPAEWVLRPIGCAFLPDPAVVNQVKDSIGSDVSQSGAADLVDAIQGPLDTLSSGSGCAGIEFDLPIGGQSFHGSILNACSGPMATAAAVSTALIGLSTVVSGGLALLRLVGAGFGYNVKVSDGD